MTSAPDLRSLSRAREAPSGAVAPHRGEVPRPPARWRTRILVPAAVIVATGGVLAYAARDAFLSRTAVWVAPTIPVSGATDAPLALAPETGAAGEESATSNEPGAVLVQAPGWVEPSPYSISVPALTEGVVQEVLVLEGETVEAGQVVVRLIDEDRRLQLRTAEANLAQRQADIERARSALATADAGIRVEQAAVDEARDEVNRKRALVDIGGVGAGEFRRLEIRLGGLQASVAAAERRADEAQAALQQAEAAVMAAQVGLDEAKLHLERTQIRSPTDGVVLARLVEPGSRISMSSKGGESSEMSGSVLRLYEPTHLQVRVDVPLADAAKVGVGTPCTVTSEALPNSTFRGAVIRAVHEANIQRNTVQFKVSIEDPSPVLKPEMLARVKLHAPAGRGSTSFTPSEAGTSNGELSLLVPASAVSATSEEEASLWVVELAGGSPVARRRNVQTSSGATEGYTLVRSGVRLTDRVILDPPPSLRDGSRVRVQGERAPKNSENP